MAKKNAVAPGCELLSISAIFSDSTVLGWTFGLLIAQVILGLLIQNLKGPMQSKSAAAAHQFACFAAFVYTAYAGTHVWLYGSSYATGASVSARYFECSPEQLTLVKMMLGFQLYDFVVTVLAADLLSTIGLVHHSVTAIFMLFALLSGSLMPYAPFFCGVAEISSLPLSIFDLFKHCPELGRNKLLASINEMSKVLFAAIFLVVRCVWWPVVIYHMLNDIYAAQDDPRFWMPAAAFHSIVAVGLTCLQQFWGNSAPARLDIDPWAICGLALSSHASYQLGNALLPYTRRGGRRHHEDGQRRQEQQGRQGQVRGFGLSREVP